MRICDTTCFNHFNDSEVIVALLRGIMFFPIETCLPMRPATHVKLVPIRGKIGTNRLKFSTIQAEFVAVRWAANAGMECERTNSLFDISDAMHYRTVRLIETGSVTVGDGWRGF